MVYRVSSYAMDGSVGTLDMCQRCADWCTCHVMSKYCLLDLTLRYLPLDRPHRSLAMCGAETANVESAQPPPRTAHNHSR